MADTARDYRTKEDEKAEQEEKNKIRFSDISLTAAWIAAGYQTFSPENIRKGIQEQWVSSVTRDITKDARFKQLFEKRRRGEGRKEYYRRRGQQVEVRRAIGELVGAHGDLLYEKNPAVKTEIGQTLSEIVTHDYQTLAPQQEELIEAVAEAQEKLAEPFKKQNDKNNKRFSSEKKGLYRRSQADLEKIIAEEKAEYQAEVVCRRHLNQQQQQNPNKKEQAEQIENAEINKAIIKNILLKNGQNILDEESFATEYKQEYNRLLAKKRGRKKKKAPEFNEAEIKQIGQVYKQRLEKMPRSTLPQKRTITTTTESAMPRRTTGPDKLRPAKFPDFGFSKLNLSELNLGGFKKPPAIDLSSLYEALGNVFGRLSGWLSKIPGLGNFFGGGGGGNGGGGSFIRSAGGNFLKRQGGNLLRKQGAKMLASQGAKMLAASTVEVWGPILLVVVIVVLLVLVIVLAIFNNPTTQPQALIDQSLTPTLTQIITPTITPAISTAP